MAKSLRTHKVYCGTDPELFIVNADGNMVPASEIFPHGSETSETVVYDNAAVEMRPGPQRCIENTLKNMRKALKKVWNKLPEGMELSFAPAVESDIETLQQYDACMEFGCDPTYLLTDDMDRIDNEPLADPENTPFRSIGFHIHLGKRKNVGRLYTRRKYFPQVPDEARVERRFRRDVDMDKLPDDFELELEGLDRIMLHQERDHDYKHRLIALLDIMIGVVDVALEPNPAASYARRNELGYGRAGEFREQGYGVEYRTPSPWWVRHPHWSWWAFAMARSATSLMGSKLENKVLSEYDRSEVTEIINEVRQEDARELWSDICHHLASIQEEHGKLRHGHESMHPFTLAKAHYAVHHGDMDIVSPESHKNPKVAWNHDGDGYFKHHRGKCFPSGTDRRLSNEKVSDARNGGSRQYPYHSWPGSWKSEYDDDFVSFVESEADYAVGTG